MFATENAPSVDTSMSAVSRCRDTSQNKALTPAHCAAETEYLLYSAMSHHLPGMFTRTHYWSCHSGRPYSLLNLSISLEYKGEPIAKSYKLKKTICGTLAGESFCFLPAHVENAFPQTVLSSSRATTKAAIPKKLTRPRGS